MTTETITRIRRAPSNTSQQLFSVYGQRLQNMSRDARPIEYHLFYLYYYFFYRASISIADLPESSVFPETAKSFGLLALFSRNKAKNNNNSEPF